MYSIDSTWICVLIAYRLQQADCGTGVPDYGFCPRFTKAWLPWCHIHVVVNKGPCRDGGKNGGRT